MSWTQKNANTCVLVFLPFAPFQWIKLTWIKNEIEFKNKLQNKLLFMSEEPNQLHIRYHRILTYPETGAADTGRIGGKCPPPTFCTKGKCAPFLKGNCPFSSVPFLDCAPPPTFNLRCLRGPCTERSTEAVALLDRWCPISNISVFATKYNKTSTNSAHYNSLR